MHQTFEELVGRHLDGLYHGALFLNAGEEAPAEDLVLWTLTGAFHEFRRMREGGASEQWLEGRLVAVFLARADPDSTGDRMAAAPSTADRSTDARSTDRTSAEPQSVEGPLEIDPGALYGAAASIPQRARAAIWLVLFRRWSYGEACRALETGVDGLKDLLGYRRSLVTAAVRRSVGRNGTDQGRGL